MSGYYPPPGAPPQQFGYPQQPPQGGQGWGQQPHGGHPGQYQQPPPQQQQQWMPPPGPPGQQFSQMPPQQGFNNYAAPPMPPPNFQQPPPPGGYQRPPPPQPQGFPQGMPPQAHQQPFVQGSAPSPGYGHEVAPGNANPEVETILKAMSGFRKDHTAIIQILSRASPQHAALIRQTYAQRTKSSLESKVETSFRGHYGDVLLQLVRGPLLADVWNINRAIKGFGTKEDMLNDVLIGRSNADMRAIKQAYHETFKKSMESDVDGDLSLKTKTMFQLIMRASRTEEAHPFNPAEITRDAEALHYATRGPSVATNQEQVFTILTQRSDNQIRAIAHEYQKNYHKTLEENIKSNFSGHMEDALLLCLGRAVDRAKTDAYGLEDTMKGLGTKDDLLVNKTVRVHWDRQNVDQVKKAYQHFFKKDLIGRVRGETSGDYRDALVACYVG